MSLSSKQLNEEKVFKDPVHRYIHVRDAFIWMLIGTKEFQRLRRIRQLGTTSMTFHGAEHSRFSHSLGVYEITRRMTSVFAGRAHWSEEDRLLALSAALLHDIGHGPFSHSFEKVFHTDHEWWTREMILGETEVNRVLHQVDPQFPQAVADVIAKKSSNKLVTSMISSQIDADRMDYLLRDAYYTGVSYGHFDLERILRVMRPESDQVVVKASGMHAVEDYIMSRYQMYWQVYFHPVTRSSEVILSKILSRVRKLQEHGYMFLHPPQHFLSLFVGKLTLNDYLRLDETVMYFYFQAWQDEEDLILRDLCTRFLHRRLFQYVEFHPKAREDDWQRLQQLFTDIGVDPEYYLVKDSSSDLPYDVYRPGAGERVPIQLLMPDGSLKELSQESNVVEAISGKTRTDYKLYYPGEVVEGEQRAVRREIVRVLNNG